MLRRGTHGYVKSSVQTLDQPSGEAEAAKQAACLTPPTCVQSPSLFLPGYLILLRPLVRYLSMLIFMSGLFSGASCLFMQPPATLT